jgi:hypothetical protein
MGFFPGMVTAPKTACETFVVQISDLGECVVYSLDEKGEPDGFVVADSPEDMLRQLAEQISPNATVTMWTEDEDLVADLTDDFRTWADVAAELNRRPRRLSGHLLWDRCRRSISVFSKYLDWDWPRKGGGNFTVTQAGLDYDAKFHPKKAGDEA